MKSNNAGIQAESVRPIHLTQPLKQLNSGDVTKMMAAAVSQTIIDGDTKAVSGNAVHDAKVTLQNNIDNEAASRELADDALQTAITNEATARAAEIAAKLVNVDCATTENITLSGAGQTIDNYAAVAGTKILVKNQTLFEENGPYLVPASGAWTRLTTSDTASELNNSYAYVKFGLENIRGFFHQTENVVTVGTSAVLYERVNRLPDTGVLIVRTPPLSEGDSIGLVRIRRPYLATDSEGIDSGGVYRFELRYADANLIGIAESYEIPLGLDLPSSSYGTWYRLLPKKKTYTEQNEARFAVDVRWDLSGGQYYEFRARCTKEDTGSGNSYYPHLRVLGFEGPSVFDDIDYTFDDTDSGIATPPTLYKLDGGVVEAEFEPELNVYAGAIASYATQTGFIRMTYGSALCVFEIIATAGGAGAVINGMKTLPVLINFDRYPTDPTPVGRAWDEAGLANKDLVIIALGTEIVYTESSCVYGASDTVKLRGQFNYLAY